MAAIAPSAASTDELIAAFRDFVSGEGRAAPAWDDSWPASLPASAAEPPDSRGLKEPRNAGR